MTLKSSKRNFLVLVKILLDETSRNQIELAEAQCGAGGGGGGKLSTLYVGRLVTCTPWSKTITKLCIDQQQRTLFLLLHPISPPFGESLSK